MKRRNVLISILVILVLLISVGYAYLETNLNINSVISLKEKQSLARTSLNKLIKLNNNIKLNSNTPDFNLLAITDEGVFQASDDYGDSYYFRGIVENNYVKFAGFYWRIVRINGDGTYRLIYDGTEVHANGESSTDRQLDTISFNIKSNDNAYVGYMYGNVGSSTYDETHTNINDSTIKTYIDNWYNTNLLSYSDYISDTEFCNDRSITDDTNNKGYGNNITYYASRTRLYANRTPMLTCVNKNDRFTVDDTIIGNGNLTYPIGLLTADEASMAGGRYRSANQKYYLYNGNWYWLGSSFQFDGGSSYEFLINPYGYIDFRNIANTSNSVRPVINIKSGSIKSGMGTMDSPFIVE